jgi:hypothetical protein
MRNNIETHITRHFSRGKELVGKIAAMDIPPARHTASLTTAKLMNFILKQSITL